MNEDKYPLKWETIRLIHEYMAAHEIERLEFINTHKGIYWRTFSCDHDKKRED